MKNIMRGLELVAQIIIIYGILTGKPDRDLLILWCVSIFCAIKQIDYTKEAVK